LMMACVRRCSISRLLCRSEDGPTLPFLPGLTDPPPKKRKAKVSVENTSASAADKSSSAEDTPTSASAADKSSSVEDTPTPPLGIRLSEAVDQRLLQLSSSRIPEKEHSAVEGDKPRQ
jgi:hypothetical protein